ncbi:MULTISPECIES: hypothetical protein [Cupriavidus]|uniref:Chemotaxis protein n=1 Tax=Cupriavidus pauculus TaxID=82633 RepID=A0A3G8H0S2_9BURK|nr:MULTISPECIES: hypothetical protein [Cupriavidus]AZG13865.1 hypothetical protein EHF44_10630 [Cupriavidus pauculus]MDT6960126.1 hypothetical protein [Cupriavidus sp. SZY C1]
MNAAHTTTGETMDLNELNVPGGTGGALGFIVAAVSGAIWFIRKAWRNDKVDGAETQAQIDIIAKLSEQVDKANARADLAEQRADTAYKERNDAYREIGELKGTIAALTAEVRLLKERLDGKDS